MNELPLYNIDIYGSWETFIEFWELMGQPPIIFNNKKYTDIILIKKEYLIDSIKKLIIKYYEINDIPLEQDSGVHIHDLGIINNMIKYDNNNLKLITMFYLTGVFVETYENEEEVYSSEEEYIDYENLNISTLNEIYELFKINEN